MNAPPNTPQAAVEASHAEFVPAESELAVVFLRMPPALKQRIKALADREKKSINETAISLISDTLDWIDILHDMPAENQ